MIDNRATDLGNPIWMMLRDSRPQRTLAIAERVKELKEYRELIDAELELLSPVSNTDLDTVGWKNSLIGFHNPTRHKGLTFNKFLLLYKRRLREKGTPYHLTILTYIDSHEGETIRFIKRRFSHTLITLTPTVGQLSSESV